MAARLAEEQEHFSSHPASASISSAGSRTHWASYWHSTSHLDQTLLIIEVKLVPVLTQPCLAAGGAAATGRDPAGGSGWSGSGNDRWGSGSGWGGSSGSGGGSGSGWRGKSQWDGLTPKQKQNKRKKQTTCGTTRSDVRWALSRRLEDEKAKTERLSRQIEEMEAQLTEANDRKARAEAWIVRV